MSFLIMRPVLQRQWSSTVCTAFDFRLRLFADLNNWIVPVSKQSLRCFRISSWFHAWTEGSVRSHRHAADAMAKAHNPPDWRCMSLNMLKSMFIYVLFVLNVRIEICSIKRSDASLDHKLSYILTVLGGKRIFVAVVAVNIEYLNTGTSRCH